MRVRFNKKLCVVMVCLLALPVVVMATPGGGFVFNFVNRFTADSDKMHEHAHNQGWSAELEINGATDFVQQDAMLAPGGFSGWHSHPGVVLVTIKSGTATEYSADDPTCSPIVHPTGSAWVESPTHRHFLVNNGSTNLEILATYLLPKGSPTRVEEPQPSQCPF
jgi:quercetin dioxygenase-like cupin family protein